ncbi:bifunctional Transcription factor TFIIB/Transcription factor TFIIB [Babesia duncani]|uniref:Bifunctional Transcription factor TFIIB/Transcription factor TFIIB n=1 Tax=Babesia duncani TaxID=323732 RepID=A0AAD9PIX9_9APIC|nr:bifunctional Transcription factor TFIIB/Transcription factor TFIIB [Babesia duncani]
MRCIARNRRYFSTDTELIDKANKVLALLNLKDSELLENRSVVLYKRNRSCSKCNKKVTIQQPEFMSEICPDGWSCGDSGIIVIDHVEGNQVCVTCGRVAENVLISDEQEWRNFNTESTGGAQHERSRVGEVGDAWLESTTSSTTFIGGSRKMQMLQNLMGNFESSDRQLKGAFSLLRTVGDALAIRDQALERAKEMIKELNESQQLKSRVNVINILAVIYLGCREVGLTRTLKELCIYDRNLTEKDLGRAINRLKKMLPNRGNAVVEDTSHLIPRFCSRLRLPSSIASTCEYAAAKASMILRTSHRTTSLAAGIIFLVVQLTSSPNPQNPPPSITSIAEVCGISENTVRSTFKELLNIANKILPPKFEAINQGILNSTSHV